MVVGRRKPILQKSTSKVLLHLLRMKDLIGWLLDTSTNPSSSRVVRMRQCGPRRVFAAQVNEIICWFVFAGAAFRLWPSEQPARDAKE